MFKDEIQNLKPGERIMIWGKLMCKNIFSECDVVSLICRGINLYDVVYHFKNGTMPWIEQVSIIEFTEEEMLFVTGTKIQGLRYRDIGKFKVERDLTFPK